MSNLDLLFERAKTEGVSADELLGRLLEMDRQFWDYIIDQGEKSFEEHGEIPMEDVMARLRERQNQAGKSA